MSLIVETGIGGNIGEFARAVVFKQVIAVADDRDIEIRVPVVVDIGERRGHADRIGHRDAGDRGDILECAIAQIAP